MRHPRRLITVATALAMCWVGVAIAPAAAAPDSSAAATPTAKRAPHDPATYYAGTEGLTGTALATKLHSIIKGHTPLSYDQVWTALQATDADIASPGTAIIDFYSGRSLLASNMCNFSGTCPANSWNREHSWAKSHGDFGTVTGPGTDLFHMRPELVDVNTWRGNLDFDNGGSSTIVSCSPCRKDSDSFEPRANIKGDVARGLFYMAVRYDGDDGFPDLQMNDFTCNGSSKAPLHGKLSTLVAWSLADPPDALEQARNDLVDGTYQGNRNPFIDHPEWVTSIWGTGVGQGPACGTGAGGGGGGGTGTPPNIVISEAYVNGGSAGATYRNKFVELYNPLSSAVSLGDYSLQYRAAASTGAATGIYNFSGSAQIPPRGYFVVKLPANPTLAGADLPQVDADASSTLVNPANAGGTLFLAGSHTVVAPDDESVGDTVGWGTSNAPETAPANGNSVTKSLQRNADNADTDDNSVDFAAANPTPGADITGNHPPTTAPMTASTPEDTPVSVPLSATDQDGDPLTWTITQAPANGSASITAATLTYTPAPDYFGSDQVGVRVSDGKGGSATTTVTITVTPVNDAPVAHDLSAGTTRNVSTTITLSASDVDNNDNELTYAVVNPPAHGAVVIDGASATYTPATDYSGDDSFTYAATDPGGATSAPATVSITVVSTQQPPVAQPVSVTTPEDQAVTFTLPASDPNGDPLTYAVGTPPPGHGSVTLNGNQATYTPAPDYHGPDSFAWTVSDGTETVSSTATITVTPVNDPPLAPAVSATTPEDTAVTFTLPGSDVDGDPLTYDATEPGHGSVSLSGNQATYTPDPDYHGDDAFTWTVSDGTATTVGIATLVVTPVNDAPVAHDVSATTDEDAAVMVMLDGEDVDGDALTYAAGSAPEHGEVEVAGDTATYTPDPGWSGQDSFTYTATDPDGETSAPATVTITVTHVNHPPSFSATLLHTTAGAPVTATLTATDPDGDPVAISEVTAPANGSVTYSGMDITYTPATRSGTETFFVTVSDGHGGTATAEIGVEIAARTAALGVSTPAATRGRPVTTTIAATGPAGPKPSGQVILKNGATTLGTATLSAAGTATVTWTPKLAGVVSLVASYAGDGLFAPATSAASQAAVGKSASAFSFGGKVKAGKKGRVKVTITKVAGLAATGTVKLKVGKKSYTAPLKGGVATFKIGKVPSKKKLKVKATYAGDGQYAGGSAKNTFKIK